MDLMAIGIGKKLGGGSSGETSNYNDLTNKPKINGMELSGNRSLSDIGAADADDVYTKTETDTLLGGKVDKETGKGLSENDYTTEEKTKLAGIAAGAEVNVQPNWAQADTSADDYIKNKPTLGTAASKNYTTAVTAQSNDLVTSAAVHTAISDKADIVDGKVPASQLPAYVDDVLEYNSTSAFPATGESGKIYIAKDTNKTYRWTGSDYAEISESLALGETSSTAYAGNKGKANADAIAAIKDGASIDSFADVETALSGKANTSALGAAASKGFDASPTSGNTNNAVSSDGVYQALAAKLNTADSMKLVYRHFLGQYSGTASYRMTTTDFAAIDNAQQCGMYLITIIKWSATPTASIYIAYYSGGASTYNALTKIGGEDAQVEIDTERNIVYTGTGKIQIYALS